MTKSSNLKLYRGRLPDALNASPSHSGFTIISNKILRNPDLSCKAKGILAMLLSNKKGEWYSYLNSLEQFTKDGVDAIRSGLKELERLGYLRRMKFRHEDTKRYAGSFWAYTNIPYQFNLEEHEEWLRNHGFQVISKKCPDMENPDMENPDMENPDMENPSLKIPNYKNTNSNKNLKQRHPPKVSAKGAENRTSHSGLHGKDLPKTTKPNSSKEEGKVDWARKLAKYYWDKYSIPILRIRPGSNSKFMASRTQFGKLLKQVAKDGGYKRIRNVIKLYAEDVRNSPDRKYRPRVNSYNDFVNNFTRIENYLSQPYQEEGKSWYQDRKNPPDPETFSQQVETLLASLFGKPVKREKGAPLPDNEIFYYNAKRLADKLIDFLPPTANGSRLPTLEAYLKLYKWWDKNIAYDGCFIPRTEDIMSKYLLEWIESQGWIRHIGPETFDPNGKVVRSFIQYREDLDGKDYFTGQSLRW